MTSERTKTVNTNSYDGLLKHLKPGDIIVTSAAPAAKGNKLVEAAQQVYSAGSRVVQGDFTHAALYTGKGKAIDIRVGQPASERAVSDILHRLDARVVRPKVDHAQRAQAVQFARGLVQAGAKYDANPLHFAKVLASDLVHVKARPPEEADENLICSNLVSRAYGQTAFSPKKDNDLLMPKDFLHSPVTRPVAHFRNPGRHDVTRRMELKTAAVDTALLPHQQRVVERMRHQPGLVVAHGLGSGKTLTSIATAEDQGGDVGVVVPAALRSNYEKELGKHVTTKRNANYDISSLQSVARGHVPMGKKLLGFGYDSALPEKVNESANQLDHGQDEADPVHGSVRLAGRRRGDRAHHGHEDARADGDRAGLGIAEEADPVGGRQDAEDGYEAGGEVSAIALH